MLSRRHRFGRQKDFQDVFADGQTAGSRIFIVKHGRNARKNSRFAVVASNKVSKKAVARNRLRRRVKAWIRENLERIRTGKDIIIIAKPAAASASPEEVKKNLAKAFQRAKLLKND